MKLKIFLLFFFAVSISLSLQSQTLSNKVVASGGSYSTAAWGSLSATVGEAVISTLSSANAKLSQGFQQPTSVASGITSSSSKVVIASAYPNPASNEIFLEVTLPTTAMVTYKVFDLNGKELITGNFTADALHTTIQKLNLENASNGMYLISLFSNIENIQNIKIQINH